jgi:hypothetical protein
MIQIPINLNGLPIQLVLLSNGQVAFVRVANFFAILDEYEDNDDRVCAAFYPDKFYLLKNEEENEYSYNTMYPYKEEEIMLEWLKSLNLIEPNWKAVFGEQ